MRKGQIEILIITNKIFSINDNHRAIIDSLKEALITVVSHNDVTEEMLSKAEIIFGWPRLDELKKAKNLRWLNLPSAGADNYTDVNAYVNKDIILTNSSGVYGLPIAEHVFAMILSFNRNLQEYAYLKEKKSWEMILNTKDFYGSIINEAI